MNVKLYGATLQKKLAAYPDRFAKAQRLQSTIPKIEELNLDETQKLKDRLLRYHNELAAYQIATMAVLKSYQNIIDEASADCEKMQELIRSAPQDTDPKRLFSLTTSVVQVQQQLVFAEQQCVVLKAQIDGIKAAKTAISLALEQNKLANLAEILATIKQRDVEIHQK